jgi:hypothetical protein
VETRNLIHRGFAFIIKWMNASADQRNLGTFKEATAMKRKLFRVSVNLLVSKVNN